MKRKSLRFPAEIEMEDQIFARITYVILTASDKILNSG